MMTPSSAHRTVGWIAGAIGIAALAVTGCPNKTEVRDAQSSVYDADFAIVYSEALAAVQDLYPQLEEDPTRGIIKTAWHPVKYSQGAEDPTANNNDGTAGNQPFTQPASKTYKRNFIRFDVTVAGGRPWRVRVVGQASEWDPGNAQPVELRGAARPHWLGGRTDALTVAIHRRLVKYAQAAPQAAPEVEEAPDLTVYGPIPAPAAKAAAAIVTAIEGRDYAALRTQVATDVVWSFGAEPGIDAALAMWQADDVALTELAGALQAGCRADGAAVSCPPAVTETPGFVGWRARFEKRGEAWLLTSFVTGD